SRLFCTHALPQPWGQGHRPFHHFGCRDLLRADPGCGLCRDITPDIERYMDTPLIEFRDVTKRFGAITVLERINLKIYEGQITTIIGLSGGGKTVLLKHMIGLLKPDTGTILFRGKPFAEMKRREMRA